MKPILSKAENISATQYVVKCDVYGNVVFTNDTFINLIYLPFFSSNNPKPLDQLKVFDLVSNESMATFKKAFDLCSKNDKLIKKVRLQVTDKKTKETYYSDWNISTIKDEIHHDKEIILIGQNSFNYNTGKKISQSKLIMEQLTNNLLQPIFSINYQGIIINANEAFGKFIGSNKFYLLGKPIDSALTNCKETFLPKLELKKKEIVFGINKTYYDNIVKSSIDFLLYKTLDTVTIVYNKETTAYTEKKELNTYKTTINDISKLAKIGWWEYDVLHRLWYKSEGLGEIFEYTDEELSSFSSFLKLMSKDQRVLFLEGWHRNLAGENTKGYFKVITKSGKELTLFAHVIVVKENDRVTTIKGVLQDVTENRNTFQLLKNIMDHSNEYILVLNKNNTISYSNKAIKKSYEAHHNKNLTRINQIFTDKASPIYSIINNALLGNPYTETLFLNMFNKNDYYQVSATPIKEVNHEINKIVLKLLNVSEQKKTAITLENNERELKKTQKLAHLSTFEYDVRNKVYIFTEDLLTYFPDLLTTEIPVKIGHSMLSKESATTLKNKFSALLIKDKPVEFEISTNEKIKKSFSFYVKAYPVKNSANKIVKISGVIQDISQRKQSEALLNSILNAGDADTYVVDKNLKVVLFNKQAFKNAKILLNKQIQVGDDFLNYVATETADSAMDRFYKALNGQGQEYERIYFYKKGKPIYYKITLLPIANETKQVNHVVITASNITAQKKLQNDLLSLEISKERTISKSVIEALEDERNTLGAELHDNVNQILGMSKLQLEYASTSPNSLEIIKKTSSYIQDAINEIRRISYNLAPPNLNDIGLESSIRVLIQKLNITDLFSVSITFKANEKKLDFNYQLAVYRIIQESLNNIIKHAGATDVEVTVVEENNMLLTTVQDNGKGFNLKTLKNKGIGLKNMQFRAQALQGQLEIESNKTGTLIKVISPI
jgi:PAS domain S-box-containing protein